MLVNRRTWIVKRGRMQETLELFKAEGRRINSPIPTRLYAPNIGSFDLLAMESEYESLEVFEKFWAEYYNTPEAAVFQEKLYELTEVGGGDEFWILVE
jgi:hypothetical protein